LVAREGFVIFMSAPMAMYVPAILTTLFLEMFFKRHFIKFGTK